MPHFEVRWRGGFNADHWASALISRVRTSDETMASHFLTSLPDRFWPCRVKNGDRLLLSFSAPRTMELRRRRPTSAYLKQTRIDGGS